MIKMFIDGSANPKKKISGVGILLIESKEQIQISEKLDGVFDNHVAEILALDYALDYLLKKNKENELIFCHSDSKMLVDAVEKRYSRKENHQIHLQTIFKQLESFSQFYLKWIPEKDNSGADHLARKGMNKKQ